DIQKYLIKDITQAKDKVHHIVAKDFNKFKDSAFRRVFDTVIWEPENFEKQINSLLEQIEKSIIKATNQNIPSKQIKHIKEEEQKSVKRSPIFKDMRRIAKKSKKKINKEADQ
ncbi:26496_t:CDS:2, partial [Gigaspora margarita]